MPESIPSKSLGWGVDEAGPEYIFLESPESGRVTLVNDYEWKQLEGQRIMPVLGAMAAVPGAAIIAASPAGAPLFCAALMLIAAAYVFWLFTDGIYHLTVHAHKLPTYPDLLKRWMPRGLHFQLMTVLYGGGSVICTVAGFAGQHSTLRGPLSVEQGFLVLIPLSAFILSHVLWGMFRLGDARTDLARARHGPDHPATR